MVRSYCYSLHNICGCSIITCCNTITGVVIRGEPSEIQDNVRQEPAATFMKADNEGSMSGTAEQEIQERYLLLVPYQTDSLPLKYTPVLSLSGTTWNCRYRNKLLLLQHSKMPHTSVS